MAEISREYIGQKIIFDSKKVILVSLNTNSGDKHRNAMNRSLVKDVPYDVISLKIEEQIF